MRYIKENYKKIIVCIFVLLLVLLSFSLCFSKSINGDEGFSLRWSMLPFKQFLERMKLDVCPFYLWIMRIILTITNNSLFAAKFLSVIFFAGMLIYGVSFLKKEFGYKSLFFYGLFITFTPTMLVKSVEIRTYALTYCLLTIACIQAYYILTKEAKAFRWIIYTLLSVAAAYTHYFAVFTLAIIYAGLWIFFLLMRNWKQIKNCFWCSAATVILYLPWVPIILKQSSSETTSWIPRSTSRLQEMDKLFETGIPRSEDIFIALLAVCVLVGLFYLIKNKTAEQYWALMCMAAVWGIWLFGLFFQEISRPIMVARYLTIPLSVTILGAASLCKYISKYLVGVCCVYFLIVGVDVYQNAYTEEYGNYANETLEFANEYIKENDIVLFDEGSLSSVIPYYFPHLSREVVDIYQGEYDYVWYLDAGQTLDFAKLDECGIKYIDYGLFGFDVEFHILYLYHD